MFDAVGFIVLYIFYVTTVGLGGRFGKILGLTKAHGRFLNQQKSSYHKKGFTYDDVSEEAKDSLPASKLASARNTMTVDGETRSRSNTATLGLAKNRMRALSNVSGYECFLSILESRRKIFFFLS